jgi:mono/diheme cytochrome c family protein
MSKAMRAITSSIVVSVAAITLSASAYGQDAGVGLRIAEAECAGCHAVGKEVEARFQRRHLFGNSVADGRLTKEP